jgi:hypothetical protein
MAKKKKRDKTPRADGVKKKVNRLNREELIKEIKKETGGKTSVHHNTLLRRAKSLGLTEGAHF